jgi:hypothetical protein
MKYLGSRYVPNRSRISILQLSSMYFKAIPFKFNP